MKKINSEEYSFKQHLEKGQKYLFTVARND